MTVKAHTKIALVLVSFLPLQLAGAVPKMGQLIGDWRYAENGHSVENNYHRDGTLSGNVAIQGRVVWELTGTWSLKGDVLNYRYTKSSLDRIPAGTTGQNRIIEIASDHYILETKDGNRHEYWRVSEGTKPTI